MRGLNFHCKIGIQIGLSVRSVYCHQDGEPEKVGVILRDNYDLEKTNELLKLGDMSWLRSTIEESNFYTRDRQVPMYEAEARDYETIDEFLSIGPVDYCYLLKDDGWYVISAKDLDNYKVIENFVTIDDALLVKPKYFKREQIKSPKW